NRANWLFNFFHSATSYQTFSGQLFRFRSMGGGITMQYPIDKVRRVEVGLSGLSISRDFTVVGADFSDNQTSAFAYPQATYTVDKTLPGFITPRGGHRYSVSLTGSPPITNNTLQFASLLGDYRKYFNLGYTYSFALRGSGAVSIGRDSQTYFMGGMLGWINQRWSGNNIPLDRLGDTFFTVPALPLRGHEFNTLFGDRFALINAEFRFPLFAAILPGPIPILPLYNLTGVAFLDAGTAWGQDIPFEFRTQTGQQGSFVLNDEDLDFKVSKPVNYFVNAQTGEFAINEEPPGGSDFNFETVQGDILLGSGFGLRTILLGFPFRYDVGWPIYRDGFGSDPIHYFSIGVDF
ncbi:MAG: BamA/TamA family outer membrane protein, partial [Balneolaceae bacterium]|nr:BamA/TamA family outer membrane protein [Balneolaceae bacterium]